MNVWETLGITSDSDIKTIKRAYAKLLKKNRPDEHPAEFQQLHAAYRHALDLVERQQSQKKSEVSEFALTATDAEITETQTDKHLTKSICVSSEWRDQEEAQSPEIEEAVLTSKREIAAARDQEFERLMAGIDKLLLDPHASCHRDRWQFLGNSSWLLENEFNHELGLEVFDRVTELSSIQIDADQDDRCVLPQDVLTFLNEIFSWDQEKRYLVNEFGLEKTNMIFNVLDMQPTSEGIADSVRGGSIIIQEKAFVGDQFQWVTEVSLVRKLAAIALDLVVFAVVAFVVSKNIIFGDSQEHASFIESYMYDVKTQLSLLIGYPLLSWVMKWSTPGKWLLGYQVFGGKTCQLDMQRGIGLMIAFLLLIMWLSFIVHFFIG
ncbi:MULTISPECIES: RDD family protein [unclassified Halomonas]|uniref:RDD family protein n=1 Tax=unclassified Halomonas TaxID=2609666 RepID=UPI0007D9DF0B|nr:MULTISPECIES: RDD family protein [unclassified Halomonas]MBT2788398.1 RDD family protein [Halomonas sp. ISL-106]MBT2797989.1 RDD family protein [Halomonas sp. ISL-104]OAL60558.1 hypothetical protein A6R74_17685 [Halomonas sp. ALS9]